MDGVQECFYSDGTLERRSNYADGLWHGFIEHFYPDGKLARKTEHKDGFPFSFCMRITITSGQLRIRAKLGEYEPEEYEEFDEEVIGSHERLTKSIWPRKEKTHQLRSLSESLNG